MELDEIKILLQQKLESAVPLQDIAAPGFFTGKKTWSLVSKIKRNIWFEFAAVMFCAVIAALIWMHYPSLVIHFFCMATWLFSMVFSIYLFLLHRKIIFYERRPETVKENLLQVINIVQHFTRLYFLVSMGLLPVIFMFGLITGYLDVSRQGLLQQFHWSKGIVFYILFFISWSVLVYFFAKWYIRKLYGNYLLQLQQQLKDIENG